MATRGLQGLSLANPWVLRDNGQLVRFRENTAAWNPSTPILELVRACENASAPAATAPPCKLIIYKGPPSSIIPRTRLPAAPAVGVARSDTSICRAREELMQGSGKARSAMTRPGTTRPAMTVRAGRSRRRATRSARARRDVLTPPLPVDPNACRPQRTALPRHDAPDVYGEVKPHHTCAICFGMKSHPVAAYCGHSFCYICIRLWLDKKRTCPVCVDPIPEPPRRNLGEEASIAYDYPDWVDESKVPYSWDGIVFPPKKVL
ncbi:hypothetical protein FB451DRAFT_1418642 [Mycena latifolia]|nr:hypothetical protein FB451DRAFT_1418642 [Mycena latifolia]